MTRKNLRETFQNIPSKSKKYAEKGNGISFRAFILSIFIYISIFYVFNLSPLALFNTTKFWFFISNTLILIIAADFGDFSSSRKRDYYEEYVKNTHQARTDHIPSSSFEFQYLKMVETKKSMDVIPKQKHAEHPREKIKDIIVYQKADESHEEIPETIVKDEPKNPNENQEDNKKLLQAVSESPKVDEDDDDDQVLEEKKNNERKCMRSKSEKIILGTELDEKKIQRSQSERYDYGKPEKMEEENDFSTMSNEELNRRVEEFIRNFNRQIRLQAIRNRQNLHAHEV